jgi:hypothetical protein
LISVKKRQQFVDELIDIQNHPQAEDDFRKENSMANIRSVQDYKEFLKENRELLHKNAVRIENLPPDDDWILDDEWDEIYEQEVLKRGKV